MFQQYPYDAILSRRFVGHTDGVWEITAGNHGTHVVGTASADGSARIWDSVNGACLAVYRDHKGSVNSIRFHSSEPLACTASGDGSVHVWPANFQGHPSPDADDHGDASSPTFEGKAPSHGSLQARRAPRPCRCRTRACASSGTRASSPLRSGLLATP